MKREWSGYVPDITNIYWKLAVEDRVNVPVGLFSELAEYYGLTQEQIKEVTDHIDELRRDGGWCSVHLHDALQALWVKYPLLDEGETRERQALRHLRGLVNILGPCVRFDPNGYCKTHFTELPCRVGEARRFLDSLYNVWLDR